MNSLQASPQALGSIGAVAAVGAGAVGAVTMAGGGVVAAVGGGAAVATVVPVAASGLSRGNGPDVAARLAAGFGRGKALDVVALVDVVAVLTTTGAFGL
jgi:hypothetical protein